MRMTRIFSNTSREAPGEAQVVSHQLLLRAGYIRQHSAGIFSALPLGLRAQTKIEAIIREEMNAIGGQEIKMPVVNPAELWQETGRWYQIGDELTRFQDRTERDMVLAMTHEEAVTDLVRREIRSYKQLPNLVYHIQIKWRDEARPRAGLIRVKEFTMKDSYSLDKDDAGLDVQYRAHYQAYFDIFHRCGLDAIAVSSDTGMMGGKLAHEYMALTEIGEDTLLLCDCGYAANRQVATFAKATAPEQAPANLQKVHTPNVSTIQALAEFLDIPASKTAKAVFMVARVQEEENEVDKFIFAVVRGDMDVNETKLTNAVTAKSLRPATEEEIKAIGAVPGFGSPLGVKGAIIVVDDAIPDSPNLVAGANEEDYHLCNVNYGRDYQADIIADIAAVGEGDACPICGAPMRAERGVEVGNIFKLGTRYSASMGATYVDEGGEEQLVVMGSYGIGVGRVLACVAETYNDDYGLMLPISIAPYQVQLLTLGRDGSEATAVADQLYMDLQAAGIEVLYDDRNRSPGIKFNDADLLGMPLRITVAKRGLKQGCTEFKRRDQKEREFVPQEQTVARAQEIIQALYAEIKVTVVEVPYKV